MDNLSRVHFETVRNEIEGRFFSPGEVYELKRAIDHHTVVDPLIRIEAAKCWPPQEEER